MSDKTSTLKSRLKNGKKFFYFTVQLFLVCAVFYVTFGL